MIRRENGDGTLLLALDRGATNPPSSRLVAELGEAVREARGSAGTRALVLTGVSGKFLSIGFDIPEIYPLDRQAADEDAKKTGDTNECKADCDRDDVPRCDLRVGSI